MKLKNVHYEYRGNDIWRIYFKDALEADTFRNITIEDKPQIAMLLPIFTNGKGVRYCVEAKLTGRFNILRYYTKDRTNDYFSNDIWRALVKKIEGADSDYIFDEIDLWYDAINDKCYFRICCMNGTWTDLFVKNILNSRFGMVAQANGYYDTDTAYHGGLCTRRSCCGIGFDPSVYKTNKERIMFSVKNFCCGEADIIKVGSWTNTFIGTNKEDEKEYSWSDFKKYMEWEYDAACTLTEFIEDSKNTQEKEVNNKEEKNMGPKDTTLSNFYKRLYWGQIDLAKVNPTKVLIQGTATIIWWSDGTKTVVKCQKGDKMDPEKGIAMCVMKKFMGTNETHSNYLDFAKDAIAEYEKQQAAEKAKKKGTAGNANYKRGAKGKAKTKTEPESTEPEIKEES